MDTGEEKIEDRALRGRLRRQGLWIALRASAVAALVTALVVAIP